MSTLQAGVSLLHHVWRVLPEEHRGLLKPLRILSRDMGIALVRHKVDRVVAGNGEMKDVVVGGKVFKGSSS